MRHRVTSLDGQFEIRANKPRGTVVVVTVPRPRAA
jgi:signal transduction histidine kinase